MCIYINRWYKCLQPEDPLLQQPAKSSRQRPWLKWKHGQLIHSDDLNSDQVPGFQWVRHQVLSKIRCATWESKCHLAPRETWYKLYDYGCPDCTGGDRCVHPEGRPYYVGYLNHKDTIKTERGQKHFDQAVDTYWACFMQTQGSIMRYAFRDFKSLTPCFHDMTEAESNTFNLFASLACCEVAEHVQPTQDGMPPECDRCNGTKFAAAHNLLRALMIREARTAWSNDGVSFTRVVDELERGGCLEHVRELRRQEDGLPQDWMTEHLINREKLTEDQRRILQNAADELCMVGPLVEDIDARGHVLIPSWEDTIRIRLAFALRCLRLISLDPGISTDFFNQLCSQHIRTLLLPWPHRRLAKGRRRLIKEIPPDPILEVVDFVTSIDHFGEGLMGMCRNCSLNEDEMIRALEMQREVIRQNCSTIQGYSLDFLGRLPVLSDDEAREREDTCCLCMEEWVSRSLPQHMRSLEMPCCGKPFHFHCLRRLLTSDPKRARCPMCRCDLSDKKGWFDETLQNALRALRPADSPEYVEGWIPEMRYFNEGNAIRFDTMGYEIDLHEQLAILRETGEPRRNRVVRPDVSSIWTFARDDPTTNPGDNQDEEPDSMDTGS